jgi:signal peptidase I
MGFSPEKRSALLKDVRQLIVLAAIILTGRSVLADWYVVPTGSMKPTILEGDRVFVWKSSYQVRIPFSKVRLFATGTPKRGDVVVIRNPDGGSVPFVKRLIGLQATRSSSGTDALSEQGPKTNFL